MIAICNKKEITDIDKFRKTFSSRLLPKNTGSRIKPICLPQSRYKESNTYFVYKLVNCVKSKHHKCEKSRVKINYHGLGNVTIVFQDLVVWRQF